MIQFVRMNLEVEGARVIQAHTGLEALTRVREELPDAVILDVMMPELDGFETLRHLREFSETAFASESFISTRSAGIVMHCVKQSKPPRVQSSRRF